jgi:hypothetical protein
VVTFRSSTSFNRSLCTIVAEPFFFSPVLLVESSTTYRFYYNIVIYNIIVYIVFVSYTEKKKPLKMLLDPESKTLSSLDSKTKDSI